jgi:hypothetical protein
MMGCGDCENKSEHQEWMPSINSPTILEADTSLGQVLRWMGKAGTEIAPSAAEDAGISFGLQLRTAIDLYIHSTVSYASHL